MPKKTNKTSHILDLITNGAPAEPGSAQDQDSAGEKTSEQRTRSSASKKVKVVDETSRNDRVSGEILSGLAKELKEELGLDEAPGSRAPGSDINETPDGDSSVQGSLVADGSTPSTPDINAIPGSDSSVQGSLVAHRDTSSAPDINAIPGGDSPAQGSLDKIESTSSSPDMNAIPGGDSSAQGSLVAHGDTSSVSDVNDIPGGDFSAQGSLVAHGDTSSAPDLNDIPGGDSSAQGSLIAHGDTSSASDVNDIPGGDFSAQGSLVAHGDTSSAPDINAIPGGDSSAQCSLVAHGDASSAPDLNAIPGGDSPAQGSLVSNGDTSSAPDLNAIPGGDSSAQGSLVANGDTSSPPDLNAIPGGVSASAQTPRDEPSSAGSAQAAPPAPTVHGLEQMHSIPWSPAQCHISECYFNRNLSHKEYTFVNVMEHLLLRQDLDSFLEEYQVCGCKRCRADVCALALSNLPSKYIVASSDSLSPLLGFYENHYKIRLMTELIKACMAVRDTPRHSAKDLEKV